LEITTKRLKLSQIKLNPDNPRRIGKVEMERLVKSLQDFPEMLELREIIVDENNIILGGNMRYRALKQIGEKECIAKVVTGLTIDQKREFIIKDNSSFGQYDMDALANLWSDLPLAEWGVDLPEDWLAGDKAEAKEDDFDADAAAESIVDPITKPGDVWLLGKHRVMCGDSTNKEDVGQLCGTQKADMVLTDPPYGVSYVGKTADALTIENDALDDAALSTLVKSSFDMAQTICRLGAYWFATVPPGPLHLIFADDWKRRGILRQIMVWAKDSMVLGYSEYHYQHEPILFGWVPGGERHKNKDRTRTTLWECPRPKSSREHPTMKPVALWARAISDGSRGQETVYDPFLGSGTTLIACEQLGRICYGMEIDPVYVDVIVKRWETLTGKKAILEV
jgi:DNA modification methylase